MMRLNSTEIQKIFYKAVSSYPAQASDYLRPQTFAAIKYREQVFATAFDKTKIYDTVAENKGLFFSREWEATSNDINNIVVKFPLVSLLQMPSLPSDHKRPLYKFLLCVFDLKNRDASEDTRVDEIKMQDLETMLASILNETIENFVYYEGVWQTQNDLTEDQKTQVRAWFRTALKNQNRLIYQPFEDWQGKKELNGLMVELEIQGDLEIINYI